MSAPKPAHLGRSYGAQFGDASVVEAYRHRPPYPAELSDVLGALADGSKPRILEIGGGSGDLTRHLLGFAGRVDVVEPSAAMRRVLGARLGSKETALRVVAGDAETAPLDPPYDLAVAGESLHWTDWGVTLPRLASVLRSGAPLAIVNRTEAPLACDGEVRALIGRYSTNTDYAPYDLIQELTARGLFHVGDRVALAGVPWPQSVPDVVETIHSRNGFSRERMRREDADAFDRAYAALLREAYPDGIVPIEVGADVVWGTPAPGPRAIRS